MRILATLMLGAVLHVAWADGIYRPETHNTQPAEGAWFDPDRPGSGFVFEIQNTTIAGYYFGYDESGAPVWRLFNHQLPDGPTDEPYEIKTNLLAFEDGACENCSYSQPGVIDTGDQLELFFHGVGSGSFSVNGGEHRDIRPILFGVVEYESGTPKAHPELSGQWVMVVTYKDAATPGLDRVAEVVELFTAEEENGEFYLSALSRRNAQIHSRFDAQCGINGDRFNEPYCEVATIENDPKTLYAPMRNVTHKRIIFEGETLILEMHRLDHNENE